MKTLSNEELQHSIDATVRLIQGDNSIRDRILAVHLENLTDEQRKRAMNEVTLEPMEPAPGRVDFDARVRGQDGPEWVEWGGGSCPVPLKHDVEVILKDGDVFKAVALSLGWDLGTRIVAYRDWTQWEQRKWK